MISQELSSQIFLKAVIKAVCFLAVLSVNVTAAVLLLKKYGQI